MKLIKIGRNKKCDLVLSSSTVSDLHAELLLLDDGTCILTDLHSLNGTFVADDKLAAGEEKKISWGDRVTFADKRLDWNMVTNLAKENAKYARVVNIGKDFRNDIRLTNGRRAASTPCSA